MRPSPNISLELIYQAKANSNATALILDDTEISYHELNLWVWKASQHLSDEGVNAEDVVAVAIDSEFLRILYSLGLMRLGATLLPLSKQFTKLQTQQVLSSANSNWLISDNEFSYDKPVKLLRADLNVLKKKNTANTGLLSQTPKADCLIAPGSGSTGKPKLIPQSHAQLRHRCTLAFPKDVYTRTQRVLSFTNTEFVAGINRLLSVIHTGGTLAIPKRQSTSFQQYCKQNAITTIFASVSHVEQLLATRKDSATLMLPDIDSLRLSGSNISMDLRHRIHQNLSKNLHIVYGANECGRISMAVPPLVFTETESVGHPLPDITIEIVDSKDKILPRGQKGHIRVRSPSTISHYIGDPVASSRYFRKGWFYTGDVGRINRDGSLSHYGRADRAFILNGINVYPAEIEATLKRLPHVLDAVVISRKHKVHGSVPLAVVAIDDEQQFDEIALQNAARQQLGIRTPHRIICTDKIPRNANGKVQSETLMKIVNSRLKFSTKTVEQAP